MKINRSKGNLQNQLAKMLQAGMENVEQEPKPTLAEQQLPPAGTHQEAKPLHATEQKDDERLHANEQNTNAEPTEQQEVKPQAAATKSSTAAKPKKTSQPRKRQQPKPQPKHADLGEGRILNAAQRHEVPDRNAKYAGEPIKSVGCRMPQSLYARMLTYKALNDSQLNRITLNDIIIDAVEKFMDENGSKDFYTT